MTTTQLRQRGGQNQKSTRNSSLELLRIFALLMIIVHHCVIWTPWDWSQGEEVQHMITTFAALFGKVGVTIFFMITGYFLYSRKKYHWKQIFKVIKPTWFYSLLFFGLAIIFGCVQWGFPVSPDILKSIMPIIGGGYWFVDAYVGLLLLSPFIKKGLDALNKKQLITMLLILIGTTVIPIFITMSLSSVSNSFLVFPASFTALALGYTIHRYQKLIKSPKKAALGVVLSLILFIIAQTAVHFMPLLGYTNIPGDLVLGAQSLPVILFSISIFTLFMRVSFYSKIINSIAGLVFGVYLIHDNLWVRKYLWTHFLQINPLFHINNGIMQFVIYFFAMILFVFIGGAIIEALRQIGTKAIIWFINFTRIPNIKK